MTQERPEPPRASRRRITSGTTTLLEMSPKPKIEPLGEHPELVELTCRWHLRAFDPGGEMEIWLHAQRREARFEGVPCAWIAFVDGVPVGSVSLVEHNMDSRRDVTPSGVDVP